MQDDTNTQDSAQSPQYITLPRQAKDITGQRFGRWLALGPIGMASQRGVLWLCQCDCGRIIGVRGITLRNGTSRSCGCLATEVKAANKTTHGMHDTPLFSVWTSMCQRCTNPNVPKYADYGGRGISVCDEWLNDFQSFYNHVSTLPHYGDKGYSIDRVDNEGNYEPGNVRWITQAQQMRNTRRNRMLTHNGKTQCATDWAKEFKIKKTTFESRLHRGWDIERALTTPTK